MPKYLLNCSCVICKKETTVQSLKIHQKFKHTIKSTCPECNTPIFNSNKFCSSSCAAKFNNLRKDYTKFKPGPPKGYVFKDYAPYTKIKQCVICEKFHPRNAQTCSKTCNLKLLSIKVNERIDNGWNPNENRNKSSQSYLEKSFESWLLHNNYNDYIKNKTFRCGEKIYFGDFYFPNLKILIELDGTQHKNSIEYDLKRDQDIFNHFSVQTIRISYKEYIKKTKIDLIKSILGI